MTMMSWRRAGAVLTAVLATAAVAATPAGAFTTSRVTDQDLSEPGIDIAPNDGTIYVNAPGGLLSNLPGSPSSMFRSTDGGASFVDTPKSLRANLPGGGDSDVSVDPVNGHLAFTDLWLGSSTVSTSADRGQSWTANPLQGVVVQDRQWLASAGSGVVYHVTHQIPAGHIVSKSIDGGLTYPISSLAASPVDQTGFIGPPGNLIAEGGGGLLGLNDKIGLMYATSTSVVKFARSTNGGLTAINVTINPGATGDVTQAFPVVADGGGGSLYAVWTRIADGRSAIMYADSVDFGATWKHVKALVVSGTSVYPWVAAKGTKVVVSLFHTDTPGEPATVGQGATWYEKELESTDSGTTFTALQTVDTTPVKIGTICTEGINCAGDRQLGDFQQIALDRAGDANMTWTRVETGQGSDVEVMFAK